MCFATYSNQKRKEKNERAAFLRVPKDEKLRQKFLKRLGWVTSVPFPDEAYLCHTHFPAGEVSKSKNGYRRARSLPIPQNPARVARAWNHEDGDDDELQYRDAAVATSPPPLSSTPEPSYQVTPGAIAVPTQVCTKVTQEEHISYFFLLYFS
jgi:hypothetical protein